MAAQTDRGVPLSTLCPKYLHANSTSHTGPFSAIAELVDNAYDPDVNAKQFWIDKTLINGKECLTFMDNGNGLDHETMHKMLSFGYSDKTAIKGITPIGMYGNGFKSGSMRLGKDAIVFSKSKRASCVGMLSQTYLEKIGANQISVPIICFEKGEANKVVVREEQETSLQDILRYSPFNTQEELLIEIDAINSLLSKEKTGTRIIIWNIRSTSTRTTEFDFEKDRYDIRIPSDVFETTNDNPQHQERAASYIPESCYSLRAYCSILYLKPRMQIIIRGQKVKSQLIAKSLAHVRKDHYKPNFLDNKRIPIIFGYNTKSKDQYGIMMYHKNRLIKAYERVGCQLKANNKGVGVIGVIECYFLEPTHNKQSFNETDKYRKTITNLGTKLEEYWNEIRHLKNQEDPNSTTPVEDTKKRPDQNWVQCDDCLQWRKLPDGIDCEKLPEKWFCRMNPDPQYRSCRADQEAVDSDDDQPSYQKTYKRQRYQEMERLRAEEERKRQHLANLAKQKQAQLRLQNKPPITLTTPRSRFTTGLTQGGAVRAESSALRSSTLSQAACSPSSSGGLPVISSVVSLSPSTLRGKRTQSVTPGATPKRPKMNGISKRTLDTSTSVNVSAPSSPSLLDDNNDTDDTDDEICILESASTPKPVKPSFDLAKVKTEQAQTEANECMLLECSEDAAIDDASETNVAGQSSVASAAVGTGPSPAPCAEVASITTQTEVPRVKQEPTQTEAEERAGQSTPHKNVSVQSSNVAIGICSFKQESNGDCPSENQREQTLQNGVKHHSDSEEAGPSCLNACEKKDSPLHYPSMTEVQEQQDQLLDLMQATAQERDSFKEKVHTLTCQLQDMQSRLQELSQINVKKECSHQACQTEKTEGEEDYKGLFERAKQKVDQLIKDKEALLAAADARACTTQNAETENDEIAIEVDRLLRELDQRNKEKDELRSQLDSLEQEKTNLASQCEELRLSLQEQKKMLQERSTTAQTNPEEAAGTSGSGTDSSSDTSKSLIELRHNIGRLLISFVPYLDLNQVNFECNVIDEILEQYLTEAGSVTPDMMNGMFDD
ncbi:MORC family CW-type zinc finger protein 3a isoform X2 [Centropristis striata]|uniref:MORC family CW-type zinc finger protein 3a isoform X2 n=1 Tax=Centropristis striata TaxID=184440 RepID=UPI0027E1AF16|nr:MORC family CW-type zinc finger protein 3a isoform X2 [Centropristis striata]